MAVVALALLAGCGGGGESDEAQIRSVVDHFTAAVASSDYEAACEALPPGFQKTLAAYAGATCETGLKYQLRGVSEELGSLTISKVTITGDSAVVGFQGANGITFQAVKEGGEWRIKRF